MQTLAIAPDEDGYTFVEPGSFLYQELEGGLPRTRADLINASKTVGVQWTVGVADYQYLCNFNSANLSNDSEPFLILLFIDEVEAKYYESIILPGTFGLISQSGETYVVGAQLEVTITPATDDEYDDGTSSNAGTGATGAGYYAGSTEISSGSGVQLLFGSYHLNGQNAILRRQSKIITPVKGSFILNCQAAGLSYSGKKLLANYGSYLLNGQAVAFSTVASPTDGPIWIQRVQASQRSTSIAYGSGIYVAGGNDSANTTAGYNVSTDNGVTWTNYAHSFANDSTGRVFAYGLAYGAGLFVAVGNFADHVTSPDGVTWTDRSHSGFSCAALKFHDGYFLDCTSGASSSIWRSIDGITFTAKTMPASRAWVSTAAAGGKSVALASDGNTAKSSDGGLTWSAGGALPFAGNWYGCTTNGTGIWFAVCATNTTDGAISTDNGATWTATNISGASAKTWTNVHYVQGIFIALHTGTTLYTSVSGSIWGTAANVFPTGSYNSWEIAYDGLGNYAAIQAGATANTTVSASGVRT